MYNVSARSRQQSRARYVNTRATRQEEEEMEVSSLYICIYILADQRFALHALDSCGECMLYYIRGESCRCFRPRERGEMRGVMGI